MEVHDIDWLVVMAFAANSTFILNADIFSRYFFWHGCLVLIRFGSGL
jgi:hypothetical protein